MLREYKKMTKSEKEEAVAIMKAAKDKPIDFSDIPRHDPSSLTPERKKELQEATERFREKIKLAKERYRAEFEEAVRDAREKFWAMTAYLLLEVDCEVSLVKLNKLLFYCDFYHYKKYKTPITGIPYVHLKQGPVPAGNLSYRIYEDMRKERIINVREEEQGDSISMFFYPRKRANEISECLSEDEKMSIRRIAHQLGSLNGTDLSSMSHEEEGYQETEEDEVIYYSAFADSLKI